MAIIAFVHIKKTGGKTIKHIMRRELGMGHCDVKRWCQKDEFLDADGLLRLRRVYPWIKSIAGHSIKPYSDLKQAEPGLKYFTFLREPISRTVSQYQYEVQQGRRTDGQFEQWIRDPANHDAQVQTLAGAPDLEKALNMLRDEMAYVGLIEYMQESLALMLPALRLPDINCSPEHINSASNNLIRDRILGDEKNMDLLRAANRLDTELYQYAKNVIFERQRRQFGAQGAESRGLENRVQKRKCGLQYYLNIAYRQLVYKPVIWMYRSSTNA